MQKTSAAQLVRMRLSDDSKITSPFFDLFLFYAAISVALNTLTKRRTDEKREEKDAPSVSLETSVQLNELPTLNISALSNNSAILYMSQL